MKNWVKELPWNLITIHAKKANIDRDLVAAVIQQESAGNPFSARYEAHYRYLVNVNQWALELGITANTEEMMQKTSFGLMQIMGGKAREIGHVGHLPELFMPDLNLHFGCKILHSLAWEYKTEPEIIAAYNAGHVSKTPGGMFKNQAHVDRVMGFLKELKTIRES